MGLYKEFSPQERLQSIFHCGISTPTPALLQQTDCYKSTKCQQLFPLQKAFLLKLQARKQDQGAWTPAVRGLLLNILWAEERSAFQHCRILLLGCAQAIIVNRALMGRRLFRRMIQKLLEDMKQIQRSK